MVDLQLSDERAHLDAQVSVEPVLSERRSARYSMDMNAGEVAERCVTILRVADVGVDGRAQGGGEGSGIGAWNIAAKIGGRPDAPEEGASCCTAAWERSRREKGERAGEWGEGLALCGR